MSTKRREPVKRGKVFGPDGVLVCKCGCGRPPGKGRRYWHSQECVEAWKIRNDPATVRAAVWKRDRGVCAVFMMRTMGMSYPKIASTIGGRSHKCSMESVKRAKEMFATNKQWMASALRVQNSVKIGTDIRSLWAQIT